MKKTLAVLAVPALVLGVGMTAQAAPSKGAGASLNVSTADGARVTSTALASGSSLVFSGCGYAPGANLTVTVNSPSASTFLGAVAGSNGCFSTADTHTYTALDAGSYGATSWVSGAKRAAASASFTVNT